MQRAYSPERLAAVLTAAGFDVTGRTIRNRIASGDLPARRNRRGHWRVSEATVRLRWPSLFFRALTIPRAA
jgi:hypothetical protein